MAAPSTPRTQDHGHQGRHPARSSPPRTDVFAHYSEIKGNGYRELTEGEHVTFDIGQGQKGPQAQNIVRG
jgi:cold shock CspA family protein